MHTTLEGINKSVNSFVDGIDPENIPEAVKESCVSYVGGFPITDPDKIMAVQNKMKNNQSTYVRDRMAVKEKLDKFGVKAKAYIPVRIWEKICDEHGLFRMQPTKENNIIIRANSQDIINTMTFWTVMPICVATFALIVCNGVFHLYPTRGFWEALGSSAIMTALSAAAIAIVCGFVFGALEEPVSWLQLWLYTKFTSRAKLLRHFMPKLREYQTSDISDFSSARKNEPVRVSLVLPEAPDNVKATLMKLTNYGRRLHVAAVPEAISFNPDFYSVLNSDFTKRLAIRREEEALRRDPIIYDIEGECVAILEQFGDFPIEQKIVDDLLTKEFLL